MGALCVQRHPWRWSLRCYDTEERLVGCALGLLICAYAYMRPPLLAIESSLAAIQFFYINYYASECTFSCRLITGNASFVSLQSNRCVSSCVISLKYFSYPQRGLCCYFLFKFHMLLCEVKRTHRYKLVY